MNGLTGKALALGGVTAALLVAAGQANAALCDPLTTVATIEATSGFSCTFGDKVLSDFSFNSLVPGSALVQIGIHNSDYTVTLNRDGTFFPSGTINNLLDYTISIAPGHTGTVMALATLGFDVSVPTVTNTEPGRMTTGRSNVSLRTSPEKGRTLLNSPSSPHAARSFLAAPWRFCT